jgi:hypothetical protein
MVAGNGDSRQGWQDQRVVIKNCINGGNWRFESATVKHLMVKTRLVDVPMLDDHSERALQSSLKCTSNLSFNFYAFAAPLLASRFKALPARINPH